MELVEGDTLAKAIPDAGMALEEFWQIAIPLVEAVGAAHEMGITHRDLKPGNLIVGSNGRVKVLDFGLAKVEDSAEASLDSEESTWAMTRTGMVLGTVPYMSPEQLQGKKADPRSDVFSLGSVLFEILSGERPFAGESSAELISAILRDDPDLPARLRSELPRGLYPVITPLPREESGRSLRDCIRAPGRSRRCPKGRNTRGGRIGRTIDRRASLCRYESRQGSGLLLRGDGGRDHHRLYGDRGLAGRVAHIIFSFQGDRRRYPEHR